MKKIIILSLVLTALVGCGKTQKEEKNVITNPELITKKEKKMGTIHLTTADFKAKVFNYDVNTEWKYEGDKPCLIDFYADWCGPCKMVAPVLEELAAEYDGQIYIYKIDTEAEQELAMAFGIRSIPSLLFVPMNGEPQMSQGAMGKADFKRAIDEILLKK
jgi:thioredoxin